MNAEFNRMAKHNKREHFSISRNQNTGKYRCTTPNGSIFDFEVPEDIQDRDYCACNFAREFLRRFYTENNRDVQITQEVFEDYLEKV